VQLSQLGTAHEGTHDAGDSDGRILGFNPFSESGKPGRERLSRDYESCGVTTVGVNLAPFRTIVNGWNSVHR